MKSLRLKLFTFLGSFFILFTSFATPVNAQATDIPGMIPYIINTGFTMLLKCPLAPEQFNNNSLIEICQDVVDRVTAGPWVAGDRAAKDNVSATGGLLNTMTIAIANPPASAAVYVADTMHRFNPVKPAYAQGVGFGALNPILPIWRAFRNIAYFLIVIAFVFIGLAIMFRARLNPQTVVNIENALPQLVITILLITFSYAIAGLLIDLMFLSIFLFTNIAKAQIFANDAFVDDIVFNKSIVQNILDTMGMLGDAAQAVAETINNSITGPGLSGVAGFVLGIAGAGVAALVFAIAIFYAAFKALFVLLKAYLMAVILVIISPLYLLGNAFPGSNAFSSWIRSLVTNLAVFPVVILMLLLAFALIGHQTQTGIGFAGQSTAAGFRPPQITGTGSSVAQFQVLLAIGLILMIPSAAEITQKAFGGGGGGAGGGGIGAFAGGAIGGALGAGTKPFTAPAGILAGGVSTVAGQDVAHWGIDKYRRFRARQQNAQDEGLPVGNTDTYIHDKHGNYLPKPEATSSPTGSTKTGYDHGRDTTTNKSRTS